MRLQLLHHTQQLRDYLTPCIHKITHIVTEQSYCFCSSDSYDEVWVFEGAEDLRDVGFDVVLDGLEACAGLADVAE